MKRLYLLSVVLVWAFYAFAQTESDELKYVRNSLAYMNIFRAEDEFSTHINRAFDEIPISDKYNDHSCGFRIMLDDRIEGAKKKGEYGLNKAKYGKTLTASEIERNGLAIENMLNESQLGKLMVAKWFNLHYANGNFEIPAFDTELVQERGQYAASDVDVELASLTARGLASLSDAGEHLIGNTYLLVNDITYVTAEDRARSAKMALKIIAMIGELVTLGQMEGSLLDLADAIGDIADAFTGFTVKTHSYLYQLQWNDSIANIFYHNYYSSTANPDKFAAFMANDSTFKVKYVEHEYEYAGKTKLRAYYDRRELVKMVCTRSLDKNIAALQAKYEDFKVKTPIFSVVENEQGQTVYTAKIGLKEGISETSSFQVLERRFDPEEGRTSYRRVATIKPIIGQVWDNRYNAVLEEEKGSDLQYTSFRKIAGGEILPGMLIVEGTYSKAVE